MSYVNGEPNIYRGVTQFVAQIKDEYRILKTIDISTYHCFKFQQAFQNPPTIHHYVYIFTDLHWVNFTSWRRNALVEFEC